LIRFPIKLTSYDDLLIRFNIVSDTVDTNKDGWIIENITASEVYIPGSVDEAYFDNQQLKTYPNPVVKDFIKLEINDLQSQKTEQIHLIDQYGRRIKRFNYSSYSSPVKQLDISKLLIGTYYLSAVDENGAVIGFSRVIIQ